jgi:hypothetical protein
MTQPVNPEVEATQPPREPILHGNAKDATITPRLTVTVVVGKDEKCGKEAASTKVEGKIDLQGKTMERVLEAVGLAAFISLENTFDGLIESAKGSNTFPNQSTEGYAILTAVGAADFAKKFENRFQLGFSDGLAEYLTNKLGVKNTTEILIKTIAQI